MLTKF